MDDSFRDWGGGVGGGGGAIAWGGGGGGGGGPRPIHVTPECCKLKDS